MRLNTHLGPTTPFETFGGPEWDTLSLESGAPAKKPVFHSHGFTFPTQAPDKFQNAFKHTFGSNDFACVPL